MKTLYLIRGPSGTGKTTIARHLSEQHCFQIMDANEAARSIEAGNMPPVFETDDFWGSDYAFDIELLSDAHKWCQLNVMSEMVSGTGLIFVSNTFIKLWEMKAYLELAEKFGYLVEIIKTPSPWDANKLFKRREHTERTTPMDVIQRHIENYQPRDDETEWTDLSIFKNKENL